MPAIQIMQNNADVASTNIDLVIQESKIACACFDLDSVLAQTSLLLKQLSDFDKEAMRKIYSGAIAPDSIPEADLRHLFGTVESLLGKVGELEVAANFCDSQGHHCDNYDAVRRFRLEDLGLYAMIREVDGHNPDPAANTRAVFAEMGYGI